MPTPTHPGLTPEQRHRRLAFWQIYLPLFFGVVVFLGLCVWAVLFTIGYIPEPNLPDQQTPAAKIAVIWLLLAPCVGNLIPITLLGGMVFLLGKGLRGVPPLAHNLLNGIHRLQKAVEQFSDTAAKPVISVASVKAGLDRFFEMIAFWKQATKEN